MKLATACTEENCMDCYKFDLGFKDASVLSYSSPVEESTSGEESYRDHSDEILKFISNMLMEEEDLQNKPCMLYDCLALQATEKSLYDVLNGNSPCSPKAYPPICLDQNAEIPGDDLTKSVTATTCRSESSSNLNNFHEFNSYANPGGYASPLNAYLVQNSFNRSKFEVNSCQNIREIMNSGLGSGEAEVKKYLSPNNIRSRDAEECVSNKRFASDVGESEPLEMYDEISLCKYKDPPEASKIVQEQSKGSNRRRPRGGKKKGIKKEVVDLRSLLTQCAQAVGNYDSRAVNELLVHIRQHSSPYGDGTERLAHYFANALEARLAGTGTALYTAITSRRISAAELLKAYQPFINICPFMKTSIIFANRSIKKLAARVKSLHIIDFGILYGFQWPCLIHGLSERSGGPPKLRITGIDLPQSGFRPAERVKATGDRLAKYCKKFNVPFEYDVIAKKWETIQLEDFSIDKNELLVVNCLYRLRYVPDETVMANSPRDAVLNLIKRINPDMFIHGVVNGTYNTPFFITRFREALFHFSSMFDVFETTVPREDQDRLLFEKEVLAKDAMNIIACEGTERVDRPETYKQWQVRNVRAGFKQLPLNQEIVNFVRNKVKLHHHKDFSVDEDRNWMLQGWKGRVIQALSFWKPHHK